MKTPSDGKGPKTEPSKGKGGGAFQRIKQERIAHGLGEPEVEDSSEAEALPLDDEEPSEADEESLNDKH